MFNPIDIVSLFEQFDAIDSIVIDENQNGNNVTLSDIKFYNTGNNCLHYTLIHDGHRIVIQTYKILLRKGDIDIVQGNPDLEPKFKDLLDMMNARPQDFTDDRLNKLFVLYCGLWQKCTKFYWGEMDTFFCEFGPDAYVAWNFDDGWYVHLEEKIDMARLIISFIDAIEEICR